MAEGPDVWMLELFMALPWVLHKYSDLVILTALLLVNAIVSFVQERRASGVIDSLRRRLHVNARVRRDGAWQLIPAPGLVPGDIVRAAPRFEAAVALRQRLMGLVALALLLPEAGVAGRGTDSSDLPEQPGPGSARLLLVPKISVGSDRAVFLDG